MTVVTLLYDEYQQEKNRRESLKLSETNLKREGMERSESVDTGNQNVISLNSHMNKRDLEATTHIQI